MTKMSIQPTYTKALEGDLDEPPVNAGQSLTGASTSEFSPTAANLHVLVDALILRNVKLILLGNFRGDKSVAHEHKGQQPLQHCLGKGYSVAAPF
jgi:hypothetical protein